MQNRLIGLSVIFVLALAPVLADTTGTTTSTTNVAPSNAQYVSPNTTQNASTANVSTQINNENLGANSFGQGITCQAPQIAVGGYGARQSSGVGSPNSDAGFSVQYLAPVGTQSTRSCQALANEVIHQRQLDTQLTFIQKCADFARSGIVLDPQIYPEMARQCAGIRLSPLNTGSTAPGGAYPHANGAFIAPSKQLAKASANMHWLAEFSPAHNSELKRIAQHRMRRIAALRSQMQAAGSLSPAARDLIAVQLRRENERLKAVVAEYRLENSFLHKIARDPSWRGGRNLRDRILSATD